MSRRIGEEWERRLIKNNKKGDENLYDYNLLPMLTISKNFFWGDHFSTLDEFYNAKQEEMKRLLIGTGVGILASYGVIATGVALYYGGTALLCSAGSQVLKISLIKAETSGIINTGLNLTFQAMKGQELDFGKAIYSGGMAATATFINSIFNPTGEFLRVLGLYEIAGFIGYSGQQFLFEGQTWEGYREIGWVKAFAQTSVSAPINAGIGYILGPMPLKKPMERVYLSITILHIFS